MKTIVMGILAHVDSGKTTLSEAMLYETGQLKKLGRVDHGDAFLDTEDIERKRGITVFSKQAILETEQGNFCLLDTPGHVDFSTEMERTLQVLDYAILIVSATGGVQSHTMTLWKLLKHHNIPTFIFVNKMDVALQDKEALMNMLRDNLHGDCVDFLDKSCHEEIASRDETLMEIFLDKGKLSEDQVADAIKDRCIFPCFFGSALKDEGVTDFLSALIKYTRPSKAYENFAAKVYKINHDNKGVRLTFLKVTGGTLSNRDTIKLADRFGEKHTERITQIRLYSGLKYRTMDFVSPGMICAVAGPEHTYAGQTLGVEKCISREELEPVLAYEILYPDDIDSHTMLGYMKQLEEEDPKLNVTWSEEHHCLAVRLMGEIQMEVLKSIILERFGVTVNFDSGKILYKETIADVSEGMGHFEPLRHYAEVHLLLEPAERGSGMCFDTNCSEDELDRNWQNLILTHLEEKEHRGVLLGAPVTDMKITLIAGKAHKKHTEGGDFRQATYRAVRQGLMNTQSVLLEPWYSFSLNIPMENLGRAISDIQMMYGRTSEPLIEENRAIITGECPVSTMNGYGITVSGYTHGQGRLSYRAGGYDLCHNEAAVVAASGYEPERDVENTADSVFCSHGGSETIPWNQVEERMDLGKCYDPVLETEPSELAEETKRYVTSIADDKELMAIFERTFGKVKTSTHREKKTVGPANEPPNIHVGRKNKTPSGIPYILIDGYNVIHAWKKLKALTAIDFGSARDALIDILNNYCGVTECRMIVVFDAYKVTENPGSHERIHNLDVVYTKTAETADMYIEKVTHKIARDNPVRVVTSDGLEQLIIMGHGAVRISADAFGKQVEQVEEAIRNFLREC